MSPATAPAKTIHDNLQLDQTGHFQKGKILKKTKNSAEKTYKENFGKKDFLCINS